MSTRSTTIRTFPLRARRNAHVVARRQSGFTILEVLVAMFILLVGGLAILNIFPPALRVIRGSENREIAISMSQSKLETYANEPATIPDAVYDSNVGTATEFIGAVSGTRIRNKSLPSTSTATDSAIDKFKKVVGERHRVLEDRTGVTAGNPGIPFVLSNFSQNGTPSFYAEEEIIGVKVQSGSSSTPTALPNGVLDFTNARLQSDETVSLSDTQVQNRLADGVGGTELYWNNPALRYYISYRYLEGTNVAGVEDEKIDISTNRVFQSRASVFKPIVAGEVSMRVLIPISGIPTPTLEEAAIGYLRLRSGAGLIQDALLRPVNIGDVVSVDYAINDWRDIIIDTSADTPSSKVGVPATARDIKLPISTLNSRPLYAMLLNKTSNGLTPQTGVIGQWGATPSPSPPVVDVSNASATLAVAAGTNPQARIAYQTSRGWAQQISVASKNYYPYDVSRLPLVYNAASAALSTNEREPWREYSWTVNSPTVYFRASEAGKTVLVTFRHAGGLVSNQVVPIDRDWVNAGTSVPLGANGFALNGTTKLARAVLLDLNGGQANNVTAILSVRGASIRSRTAWIENNNYVQEIKEDYRPLTD